MPTPRSAVLAICLLLIAGAEGQTAASPGPPLRLAETIPLLATVHGKFDHLAVDRRGNRLFVASEDAGAVYVVDLASGRPQGRIGGLARPHAVFFHDDPARLVVTDGGTGTVHIYDGTTLRPLRTVALRKDADSLGYDASLNALYVENGGGEAGASWSAVSAIDLATAHTTAEMHVAAKTIDGIALDTYRPRTYVDDVGGNAVVVIDRWEHRIVARWTIAGARGPVALALDEPRQRLFVGCRSGAVVVLDTNTGRMVQTLAIPAGVDDLAWDAASRRLYAAADGVVAVYQQTDADHYTASGTVPTGPHARTARLVPELGRYFVAAPAHAGHPAAILAFGPVGVAPYVAPSPQPRTPVDAPVAEALVRHMLSMHPYLRKMGLHVVPPGGSQSILIANGNATRLGIATTDADFAAVASGTTYGPAIPDGAFYNMKMPMFDAQNRRIGILVMEIPFTTARDETDAAHRAEAIRAELAAQIPSLDALFRR